MEGLLIKIFAFFIVYKMYKTKYVKRLSWFFFAILFIPDNFVMFDGGYPTTSSRFFIFFLFLITAVKSSFFRSLRPFPLKMGSVLLLLGFLVIAIFDARLNLNIVKILNRSLGFFIDNYLPLLLAFILVKDFSDVVQIYKVLLSFFIIFCVYGIFNYVTGNNFYITFISKAFNAINFAEAYTSGHDGRYRITSFAWHPIYYGFLLSIAILMNILMFNIRNWQSRNYQIILLLLLLINLFMVNSRTPFFALLGGVAIYFIFGLDLGKKVQIFLVSLFFVSLAVSSIPKVNEFVTDSFETFSERGSKLEGSSVELRNYQLGASLLIFNKSPITGNGFMYIEESLGFKGRAEDRASDASFAGFESYLYKLLIEQGIVGMVVQFVFSVMLLVFIIRSYFNAKSAIRKRLAIVTISMFVCFLMFIFGTGDMGTFKFMMPILGINLKGLLYLNYAERNSERSKEMELSDVGNV